MEDKNEKKKKYMKDRNEKRKLSEILKTKMCYVQKGNNKKGKINNGQMIVQT